MSSDRDQELNICDLGGVDERTLVLSQLGGEGLANKRSEDYLAFSKPIST